jgi:uncharacterized membrane protein YcaP (DUF421 family)
MDAVFSAVVLYLVVLLMFRLTGRRSLGQATPFDFVLLLLIGEATQQALLGSDSSLTKAVLVITTLLAMDVALSLAKRRWRLAEKLIEGVPTVLVADGKVLRDRLHKARVSEDDVLQSARASHGLLSIEEIRYAILETNGLISIIPTRRDAQSAAPARIPIA